VEGGGQQRNLFDMKAQNLHYEVVDLQGGHVRNSIMNLWTWRKDLQKIDSQNVGSHTNTSNPTNSYQDLKM
jgi:hypothetical protein